MQNITCKHRRQMIVALVKERKAINVNELASHFGVTVVTIRSDLRSLEAEGFLFRSHGQANALECRDENSLHAIELSINEKQNRNHSVKVRLAVAAMKYIKDNDVILLDSGSTTLEIARQIARKSWTRITVITNSVPICVELADVPNVHVYSTGGRLRPKSKSFAGMQAERAIRAYRFSKLFISADGFDIDKGITTHADVEANLNRIMCEQAKEIYMVADYTKFGKVSAHWIRDFDDIDYVITDSGLQPEYLEALRNAKVIVDQIKA